MCALQAFVGKRTTMNLWITNSPQQNTEYINNVPFLASLQSLRISMRITPPNASPICRYITDHAHCATQRIWATFVDKTTRHNLGAVSICYWHWQTPSAHAEQNGTPSVAHVKKVTFDSMDQGRRLTIKSRDGSNVVKTYYGRVTVYEESCFFPVEQDGPEQPFVMPFLETRGDLFM